MIPFMAPGCILETDEFPDIANNITIVDSAGRAEGVIAATVNYGLIIGDRTDESFSAFGFDATEDAEYNITPACDIYRAEGYGDYIYIFAQQNSSFGKVIMKVRASNGEKIWASKILVDAVTTLWANPIMHAGGLGVATVANTVAGSTDITVCLHDHDGNHVWTRKITSAGAISPGSSIHVTEDAVYVAYVDGTNGDTAEVVKFEADGDTAWKKNYDHGAVQSNASTSLGFYNSNLYCAFGIRHSTREGFMFIVINPSTGANVTNVTATDPAADILSSRGGRFFVIDSHGAAVCFVRNVGVGDNPAVVSHFTADLSSIEWQKKITKAGDDIRSELLEIMRINEGILLFGQRNTDNKVFVETFDEDGASNNSAAYDDATYGLEIVASPSVTTSNGTGTITNPAVSTSVSTAAISSGSAELGWTTTW